MVWRIKYYNFKLSFHSFHVQLSFHEHSSLNTMKRTRAESGAGSDGACGGGGSEPPHASSSSSRRRFKNDAAPVAPEAPIESAQAAPPPLPPAVSRRNMVKTEKMKASALNSMFDQEVFCRGFQAMA
jgi:hypothetical protein